MATVEPNVPADAFGPYPKTDVWATLVRAFAWSNVAFLIVYIFYNFVDNISPLPNAAADDEASVPFWREQTIFYVIAVALTIFLVVRNSRRRLRADFELLTRINTYIIRSFFWAVLFVGVGDFIVSFMSVEGHIETLFGRDAYLELRKQDIRGLYVHLPLVSLGFIAGMFMRTLGFFWLALLVVIAELGIVIGQYVFSYGQPFIDDLVRYWYAALFLFASAYTLLEDGHVRVDVFYAALKDKMKGRLNAIGALMFGLPLCWTIIIIGFGGTGSPISSPVFGFERSQQDAGLYIKYQLAAFIGIFAITMLIQFCALLLESIADMRNEPGRREREESGVSQ